MFADGEKRQSASGAHHVTLHDLQAAAQSFCGVCHILAQKIKRRPGDAIEKYAGDPLQYQFHDHRKYMHGQNTFLDFHGMGQETFASISLTKSVYSVALDNSLSTPSDEDIQNMIPSATNTGDPAVAQLASRWLGDCLRDHSCREIYEDLYEKHGQRAGWFPDRLLDLTGEDPRLLVTREEVPIHSKYATLSYSWGPNPKHLTLTSDNLPDMRKKILMNTLQKTFRDAIQTARTLDIFYLWIDSLCIIQSGEGSQKDWEEQAAAMNEIYSNCFLNLSADHAANAEEGCFVDRDLDLLKSVYFKWNNQDHVLLEDDIYLQFMALPLSQRGWVLQERLLSPRILHFGRDQIFWECQEISFASEIFPGGLETHESHINEVPFNIGIPRTGKSLWFVDWWRIVLQYSKCSLTFPVKDKFVAIGAIAERYAELCKSEYVAGSFLFDKNLPNALLWRVAGTDESPASAWTGEYRAPTWSWMNIDGPVDLMELGPFKSTADSILGVEGDYSAYNYTKVIDLQIDLVNPNNKFGPIKSARIKLQCRLFSEEFLKVLEQSWRANHLTRMGKEMITLTSIMDTQPSKPDNEMPLLLPISRTTYIHGLFLKQEDPLAEKVYSRLGYFRIDVPYENPWRDRVDAREILGVEKIITLI